MVNERSELAPTTGSLAITGCLRQYSHIVGSLKCLIYIGSICFKLSIFKLTSTVITILQTQEPTWKNRFYWCEETKNHQSQAETAYERSAVTDWVRVGTRAGVSPLVNCIDRPMCCVYYVGRDAGVIWEATLSRRTRGIKWNQKLKHFYRTSIFVTLNFLAIYVFRIERITYNHNCVLGRKIH